MPEEKEHKLISGLVPAHLREKYLEIVHKAATVETRPRVPNWVMTALRTARGVTYIPAEMTLRERDAKGEVLEISTESNLTAIVEAVQTAQVVSADAVEEVRDKHQAGWLTRNLENVTDFYGEYAAQFAGWLLDLFHDLKIIPDIAYNRFKEMLDREEILSSFVVVLFIIMSGFQATGAYASAFMKQTERKLNEEMRPDLPQYQELMAIWYKDPERGKEIDKLLAQFGIPDQYIGLLKQSIRALYDFDTIRTLYLRGEMPESKAIEELQRHGYVKSEAQNILKTWWIIPSPDDIMRIAVREGFREDVVREFGLDEDYPPELNEYAPKVGLSKEWAKYLWRAHWILPSPTMAFEMLHRTEFDEDNLDMILRAADYPPIVRKYMKQIAYVPLTRVDVRRMFRVGVLDAQGVYQAYRELGYNHKNAGLMTSFTVRFESGTEKDLTQGKILEAYKAMIFSKRDTLRALQELGYDKDEAETLIDLEDFDRQKKFKEKQIKAAERRYKLGLLNEDKARAYLMGIEVDGDRISELLEDWKLDKIEDMKEPTTTQLNKWYMTGIITEELYRVEMKNIGWDDRYINYHIQEMALP